MQDALGRVNGFVIFSSNKAHQWSFLQRFYLDNVFFLREKNLSSFLLDVDGFSRVFLLKIFDFRSEPGEFLVFVLSTVSLAHRGRKTKFFSRDVPNWLCEAQKLKKFYRRTVKIKNLKQKKHGKTIQHHGEMMTDFFRGGRTTLYRLKRWRGGFLPCRQSLVLSSNM